jgi:hypothetical protein
MLSFSSGSIVYDRRKETFMFTGRDGQHDVACWMPQAVLEEICHHLVESETALQCLLANRAQVYAMAAKKYNARTRLPRSPLRLTIADAMAVADD